MDNITLADLWAHAIEGYVTENAMPHEIEKFKLFFYSGAYALIGRNHHLQINCETKEQYLVAMGDLEKECVEIYKQADPEKKPFLRIVK